MAKRIRPPEKIEIRPGVFVDDPRPVEFDPNVNIALEQPRVIQPVSLPAVGPDPDTGFDPGIIPADLQGAVDGLVESATMVGAVEDTVLSGIEATAEAAAKAVNRVVNKPAKAVNDGLDSARQYIENVRRFAEAGQAVLFADAVNKLNQAGQPLIARLFQGGAQQAMQVGRDLAGALNPIPPGGGGFGGGFFSVADHAMLVAKPDVAEKFARAAIAADPRWAGVPAADKDAAAGGFAACMGDIHASTSDKLDSAGCRTWLEGPGIPPDLIQTFQGVGDDFLPPDLAGEAFDAISGSFQDLQDVAEMPALDSPASTVLTPETRDQLIASGIPPQCFVPTQRDRRPGGCLPTTPFQPQSGETPPHGILTCDDPEAKRIERILCETAPNTPERRELLKSACETPPEKETRTPTSIDQIKSIVATITDPNFLQFDVTDETEGGSDDDLEFDGSNRCGLDFYASLIDGNAGYGSDKNARFLKSLFGAQKEDGGFISSLSDMAQEAVGGFWEFIFEFLSWGISAGARGVQNVANLTGCNDDRIANLVSMRAVVGFFDQWMTPGFADLLKPLDYQISAICPTELPTASEASGGFLADEFTADELDTLARSNNKCPDLWKRLTHANRSKLSPGEITAGYLRKQLTRSEAEQKFRETGYTDKSDIDTYFKLSELLPFASDLYRYMVRDVWDESVVKKFEYDDGFDDKFTGEARELFEAQGIKPEWAKLGWRAHWQIPAFGQLASMFHRSAHRKDDDALKTTLADIREALKVNDIAPGWIDRLIDTTFHLVGRRDARRLLRTFVWTHDDFAAEMRKQGFRPEVSEALADEAVIDARRQLRNDSTFKELRRLDITEEFAEAQLLAKSIPEAEVGQLLNEALDLADQDTLDICRKATVDRYKSFEIDEKDLERLGQENGFKGRQLRTWVRRAKCERASRGKEFSLGLVKQLFDATLLNRAQTIERIERIGYGNADAIQIVALWVDAIDARAAKEADKARAKAAAELKKARAEEARRVAKVTREAEKSRKELEASRKKAERDMKAANKAKTQAAERRKKLWLSIVKTAAKNEQVESDAVEKILVRERRRIKRAYGLGDDLALRALAIAVDSKASEKGRDLVDRITDAAEASEDLVLAKEIVNT